jgi:hypothetical protein
MKKRPSILCAGEIVAYVNTEKDVELWLQTLGEVEPLKNLLRTDAIGLPRFFGIRQLIETHSIKNNTPDPFTFHFAQVKNHMYENGRAPRIG